jgi:hypothetical protein
MGKKVLAFSGNDKSQSIFPRHFIPNVKHGTKWNIRFPIHYASYSLLYSFSSNKFDYTYNRCSIANDNDTRRRPAELLASEYKQDVIHNTLREKGAVAEILHLHMATYNKVQSIKRKH